MADIALLVVEEFERTTKRKQQGRGGQELPAASGDRAASATASKASEWGSWAAAVTKEAAAGPTAALAVAAVDGFFSA